jgi:hypothetical protein
MKKKGIGEIAQNGGWSAVLRDIEQSNEPTVITRGNVVVAVMMPCNDAMSRYLEDSLMLGKVLSVLTKENGIEAAKEYLVHQMLLGYIAKMGLIGLGGTEMIASIETNIGERMHASMLKHQTMIAGMHLPGDRATLRSDPSTGKPRAKKGEGALTPSPSPKEGKKRPTSS